MTSMTQCIENARGQNRDNTVEAFLRLVESGVLKNRAFGSREELEEEDLPSREGKHYLLPLASGTEK